MNYNFFAGKEDKLEILDFIIKGTDLHIYDLSSEYGKEIRQYKTADEIALKLEHENGNGFFQLWTPRHCGQVIFRKIELDPKRCEGHTFRYATSGWGLIQLYFGGLKNNELNYSHIGHFNEKGAMKWQDVNSDNGSVSAWNWTEIQATSRKLKYYIHNKLAKKKMGSFGVLKGAVLLEQKGIILR